MNRGPTVSAMFGEMWAVVRSEAVISCLIALLVAGMCVAVGMTAGRAEGVQQQVLGSIDAAGTRSIVVRAEPEAGVDSSVIGRLAALDGVEWVGAFGPVSDARNAAFEGGTPVAARLLYTTDSPALGIPEQSVSPGQAAFGSPRALRILGLPEEVGVVRIGRATELGVVGRVDLPDHLGFLDPHLIVPAEPTATGPVALLVVVADSPALVGPVSEVLRDLLAAVDPNAITITTSEAFAQLRAVIGGQLGAFSESLVVAVCVLLASLLSVLGFGVVMLQRKEFGRRRALGATRGFIVAIVLLRTLEVGAIGAVIGSVATWGTLMANGDPVPDVGFLVAVGILAILTAGAGALLPAIVASRRDPALELRVP